MAALVAFANVLIVSIFALLAYVFGKWWIVLFSIFFLMRTTSNNSEASIDDSDDENEIADK